MITVVAALIEKYGKFMSLNVVKDENADSDKIVDFITHLSDNTYHDYEKALEYYEKAAKAGHTSAQAAYDRVKRLIVES